MKGDEEENEEPDHETFVSQAIHELRCGSADIALDYLNNALKLEQDDDMIYIMRAQCLVRLGRAEDAIKDAEVALKANR